MRKQLICANWKMNHTLQDGIEFFEKIKSSDIENSKADAIVFPSFTLIQPLAKLAAEVGITIGGQNINENENGAFTGEISASMLTSCGASSVIIGHSERRDIYGESDDLISKKIIAALKSNLKVILCVGEHIETREDSKTADFVRDQLTICLAPISDKTMENITIAYEPIWAIGTGLASSKEDAEEIMAFIRNWLADRFNADIAEKTRILYGGSVKPGNMAGYAEMENIDGALVGGASLDAESFLGIINAID